MNLFLAGEPFAVVAAAVATHELIGRFQRIVWEAQDRSIVIASIIDASNAQRTVKGPLDVGPMLKPGVSYRFHGSWERHVKFGEQFAFGAFSAIAPAAHDSKGVVAYLTAVADNVGEKRAMRLWEAFGAEAVNVLRQSPETVADAKIMSLDDAIEASESLRNEQAFEGVKIDLLTLFAKRGFHQGRLIKACITKWGRKAPERIRKNPYVLLLKKLPSAGFKRCDRLYLDLGLPAAKLKRQALSAWYAISSDSSGHTWMDGNRVARTIAESIAGANPRRALRLAIRARLLAKHRDAAGVLWIAEQKKAHSEAIVADKVREMVGTSSCAVCGLLPRAVEAASTERVESVPLVRAASTL